MNLLNEDNVVHVFLNKLGDIVIANLLFILCCIPVITIGPSLTALYHCMMRTVKGNNNGTTKTFFRAFKENFKQSLIIWLLILAAGAVIILNIRFLLHAEGSAAHMLFYLSVGVLTLLIIFTLYIFPVIATFANTLGALCRNAFLLAFMHFPTTIAIAVITIFPLYMTYLDAKLQPLYVCCWFFFGFGLVAFINSMLSKRRKSARGKALRVAKPAFPPRAPPFRARYIIVRCGNVLVYRHGDGFYGVGDVMLSQSMLL